MSRVHGWLVILGTVLAPLQPALLAQGQFVFGNRVVLSGIDAPVFDTEGNPLEGPAFLAQAYITHVGSDPVFPEPVDSPVPLGTGTRAGYVVSKVITSKWFRGGTTVTVEMRVWEAAYGPSYEIASQQGGRTLRSDPIQLTLAEAPLPPPDMVGLRAFKLVAIGPPPMLVDGFAYIGDTHGAVGTLQHCGTDVKELKKVFAEGWEAGPLEVSARVSGASRLVLTAYEGTLPGTLACTVAPANEAMLRIEVETNVAYTLVVGRFGGTGSGDDTLALTYRWLKAKATLWLDGLLQNYDGSPKLASATTSPAGLQVSLAYRDQQGRPVTYPIQAGIYEVVATVVDPHYEGTAHDTLVIRAERTFRVSLPTWGQDGTVRLVVEGTPGGRYLLQGSHDLENWAPVGPATQADTNRVTEFWDAVAPNPARRFYRALLVE